MSLNLDNFESDFSRQTPFILNSPTSLEVCAHLNIKPKELLYQSLEKYEETCCDRPLSHVYRIYEENETERQEKLLRCRELREALKSKMKMTSLRGGNRTRRYPSSSAVHKKSNRKPCTSDTESNDGNLHLQGMSYASRSVPDLRSNLDFHKAPWSARQYCPCQVDLNDREIIADYLKRYGDILSSTDLSHEDRKIMERLILKKGREQEWDKKTQQLRKSIEKDRIQRFSENQLLNQRWHERLSEKRRIENLENTKRYLQMQEKNQQHREELQNQLMERDKKVQKYLEDINYQKNKSLVERQKQEALRQLEVGKAIEKIMEEDREHRLALREKLQRRMTEASVRKRRREQDYWRHLSEMNRIDDVKRSLKLERLEQKTREAVEELRNQIEEKEHRARMNYLSRVRLRNSAIGHGAGSRNKAIEKAQNLHAELLKGLDDWHKKVLDLHLASQERAQMKYHKEMERRRARVASERVLREGRTVEMLRRVHDMEEKRKELVTNVIQSKETKTARLIEEKERRVQISRIRAQHAAELRQELKEKLDPETFDKKAARVEMEVRVLKRTPPVGFSMKYNPRLLQLRRCTCRC